MDATVDDIDCESKRWVYTQDFLEELQSLPSRTYPSGPDPIRTPPPGPDPDPILTRFGPEMVDFGSEPGQNLGNENSAQSFSDRSFWKSLRVVDVRAFGSWMSAPKCLFFQDLGRPDRSFGSGYPREWPPDVRGMSVPKTSSLGWLFVLENQVKIGSASGPGGGARRGSGPER